LRSVTISWIEAPLRLTCRDRDMELPLGGMLRVLEAAAGYERVHRCDFKTVAERVTGDAVHANLVGLGVAYQVSRRWMSVCMCVCVCVCVCARASVWRIR